MRTIVYVLGLIVWLAPGSAAPRAQELSKDPNGWTVLQPSADTRIHYVSTKGDDARATPHAPGDPLVGSDPFRPAGAVRAYRTIAAAMAAARNGAPDWVLLERGGDWSESVVPKSGRAAHEPFVVASYGAATPRPLIKNGAARGFELNRRGFRDVVLSGIEFYSHTRDPQSPNFQGPDGAPSGVTLDARFVGERVLIEDCCFRFNMVGIQTPVTGTLRDITLRRNLFLDSYSVGRAHSQGLFTARLVGIRLEENIFDHNGWNEDRKVAEAGKATMFNHNIYMTDSLNLVAVGNVFLRASSIGVKLKSDSTGGTLNPVLEDNLFVEGEIGISAGGNTDEPARFVNVLIANNVFTHIGRAQPTKRVLAWGVEVADWDGGTLGNNLFTHQVEPELVNTYAIAMRGTARNVTVVGNIVWDMLTRRALVRLTPGPDRAGLEILDNFVQSPAAPGAVVQVEDPLQNSAVRGNRYVRRDGGEFHAGRAARAFAQDEWGQDQSTASRFPDPGRTLETYQASLGGKASFDDFIRALRSQSRSNWRPEYTAPAINHYFRGGFGMKRVAYAHTPVPLPEFASPPPANARLNAAAAAPGRANQATPPTRQDSDATTKSRRRTPTKKAG